MAVGGAGKVRRITARFALDLAGALWLTSSSEADTA
jgi:hypothetical protein